MGRYGHRSFGYLQRRKRTLLLRRNNPSRDCPRKTVANNRLRNNSQAEHERYDEVHVGDFEGNGSSQCMITNNHITISGRLRTRYGIFEAPENDGETQEKICLPITNRMIPC